MSVVYDSPMVSFRDVCYDAGGRSVLQGLTLDLARGETLVLLGRSGSGKTTALRMVNAMLFPSRGDVLVAGISTREWDPIRLRRGTGYVMQDVGLFPHFTVARNVGLVPEIKGRTPGEIAKRVEELLEQVGLPAAQFASRYPRELSGGQRQRVGVARALAADPPLLLFDEPFGALDPITRLEAQRLFLSLRERLRKSAIFVTHDVREALALGSRIGLLSRGRLELVVASEEFVNARGTEVEGFLAILGGGR